ncbi:hypothetical protein, partial [Roseateles sp. PN1]|uniref:hypothetical protein n=1 Tax=Roseateles sp. PN1 TaxID=3137372 RepID=UPI003138BF04
MNEMSSFHFVLLAAPTNPREAALARKSSFVLKGAASAIGSSLMKCLTVSVYLPPHGGDRTTQCSRRQVNR